MQKLILTDIDDTILQFSNDFQRWATQERGCTFNHVLRDCGNIEAALGCDRDRSDALVTEFAEDPVLFSTLTPEPDALEVLPILHGMGYQFVAISSCVDGDVITEARRKNLEAVFGFAWPEVHCVGLLKPKHAYLERYAPTWWVEDNANNAVVGAGIGHRSILLDRGYNRHQLADENPMRMTSWHDILEAIVRSERDAA